VPIRHRRDYDEQNAIAVVKYHYQQWRTQKILLRCFVEWHMVVICIWCALFVTSQFEVIFMLPNQRFGKAF